MTAMMFTVVLVVSLLSETSVMAKYNHISIPSKPHQIKIGRAPLQKTERAALIPPPPPSSDGSNPNPNPPNSGPNPSNPPSFGPSPSNPPSLSPNPFQPSGPGPNGPNLPPIGLGPSVGLPIVPPLATGPSGLPGPVGIGFPILPPSTQCPLCLPCPPPPKTQSCTCPSCPNCNCPDCKFPPCSCPSCPSCSCPACPWTPCPSCPRCSSCVCPPCPVQSCICTACPPCQQCTACPSPCQALLLCPTCSSCTCPMCPEPSCPPSSSCPTPPPSDCADLYASGARTNGIYTIAVGSTLKQVQVYCDMVTDGGGWTVFHRRLDGSVDFHRLWQHYAVGFGDLNTEFWLGNDNIHSITATKQYHLRIDIGDWSRNSRFAEYTDFKIASKCDFYRLTSLGDYCGNAGNSLIWHLGAEFYTQDRDNGFRCASLCYGAWWYLDQPICHYANLCGRYFISGITTSIQSNCWFYYNMNFYSLQVSEMKCRPANSKGQLEPF